MLAARNGQSLWQGRIPLSCPWPLLATCVSHHVSKQALWVRSIEASAACCRAGEDHAAGTGEEEGAEAEREGAEAEREASGR